jgi:hypothetical protein
MTAQAYPLQWPEGWPRARLREQAVFKTSFVDALAGLFRELELMGARHIVLSTNCELRRDGKPRADREPHDPGVAVYFEYKKKPMTFACDRWSLVRDNIQAVRKTIEALRGIERWGASDMMERAFTGFTALPDQTNGAWWAVLGVDRDASPAIVEAAYRAKRSESHPDKPGGSHDAFVRITEAWNNYESSRA